MASTLVTTDSGQFLEVFNAALFVQLDYLNLIQDTFLV